MTYAIATTPTNVPKDSNSESKDMIFIKTVIDKEDHNLVTKLCNSKVIFGKFRIYINRKMDLAPQKL